LSGTVKGVENIVPNQYCPLRGSINIFYINGLLCDNCFAAILAHPVIFKINSAIGGTKTPRPFNVISHILYGTDIWIATGNAGPGY
jgi:hypothetical protein